MVKINLIMRKVVIILALMLTSAITFAQDVQPASDTAAPASKFAAAVDIVYPYLWRGIKLNSNKVAFQPYLSYAFTDKLTFGLWGSTNFSGTTGSFNEFDWYASYQVSPIVKLMVSDYYFDYPGARAKYFDYSQASNQAIDFTIALDFTEKGIPLDFQWNTLIAGNDYKYDSNGAKSRNFSSYSEVGYTHSIKEAGIDLRLFAGAILGKSLYYETEGFSFTNVGLNVSKEIKFSEKFVVPAFIRYTYNQNGNVDANDVIKHHFISGGITLTIK